MNSLLWNFASYISYSKLILQILVHDQNVPYICYCILNLLVLGVDDVFDKLDIVCPVRHLEYALFALNTNLLSEGYRHYQTLPCSPHYCFNNGLVAS